MNTGSQLYEFVFRGFLADEALDRAGRLHPNLVNTLDTDLAARLGVEVMDEAFITSARQMAVVYMAICAFENSARKFVSNVLLEKEGEIWWDKCVSANVTRKVESRQKDEEKVRWCRLKP
jgi:hypothetical protein